jgi:hypothetical protein
LAYSNDSPRDDFSTQTALIGSLVMPHSDPEAISFMQDKIRLRDY